MGLEADAGNRQGMDPESASAPVVGLIEYWNAECLPTHCHGRHQLMYSMKGSMHVVTEFGSWMLPPRRALWIRGGTPHSFAAKRLVELSVLYIEPTIMPALEWQDCTVVNVNPLVRELITASVGLPWDYRINSSADRLVRVLVEQLASLPSAPVNLPEASDHRVRRVTSSLRLNPGLKDTLEELSSFAGASPRTLERIFRDETGMSFSEWRHRLRLVQGLEMLSDGLSVNSVAEAVGYDNPSSFISAFRRHFGTTPGNYFK